MTIIPNIRCSYRGWPRRSRKSSASGTNICRCSHLFCYCRCRSWPFSTCAIRHQHDNRDLRVCRNPGELSFEWLDGRLSRRLHGRRGAFLGRLAGESWRYDPACRGGRHPPNLVSGCFGLTEPLVGSGTGGGLMTTAKREGDIWVLNGQKKWIGNSTWCDISVIWARDLDDNQVKGFVIENKSTQGFSVEKIQNKIALKVVQNGLITLDNCRVPEENRLQMDKSFRDTAKVLRMTRYLVGWEATGCQMGAYEHALKYAQQRLQFGKPIATFQLMQDLLAKMLGNVTACQCLMLR